MSILRGNKLCRVCKVYEEVPLRNNMCIPCYNAAEFENYLMNPKNIDRNHNPNDDTKKMKDIEDTCKYILSLNPETWYAAWKLGRHKTQREAIIADWYKSDIPWLVSRVKELDNKVTQLKRKVETGPCGKCRKVIEKVERVDNVP